MYYLYIRVAVSVAFPFRYARFFDALRMTRRVCISPCVMLSLPKHPAVRRINASAPMFLFCSHLYNRCTCKTLNGIPHLSGPRRYFFHHSYRVLSLQNCPSLAGKTGGTRIEKYRPLVMPPRFVRRLRNNTAQSLVQLSCSALICSPPLRLVFRLRSCTVR